MASVTLWTKQITAGDAEAQEDTRKRIAEAADALVDLQADRLFLIDGRTRMGLVEWRQHLFIAWTKMDERRERLSDAEVDLLEQYQAALDRVMPPLIERERG
jgi:hypothetical protein